jgi:hypothetical protein
VGRVLPLIKAKDERWGLVLNHKGLTVADSDLLARPCHVRRLRRGRDMGVSRDRSRRLAGREGIQEDMAGTDAISSVFISYIGAGTWASAVLGGALAMTVNTWRTSRTTSLNRRPHRQEYVHLQGSTPLYLSAQFSSCFS